MTTTAPEWLTKRGGEVKPSLDGHSLMIYLAEQPQYLLEPLPAEGKFSCKVLQTINGKRLDEGGIWDSRDKAFEGGLERLKEALGWS